MMKLRTAILFQVLLKVLRPAVVCDVGSLDAATREKLNHLIRHLNVAA